MQRKYNQLVELLKDEIGEDLRAVGKYSKDNYEVLYARDDVERRYNSGDLEDIHHEMVLKGLENQYMESLFQDDDLKCSIYQFEDTVRLHFVHQDYRGYYVSFDYSKELDPSEIVKKCTDMMETDDE